MKIKFLEGKAKVKQTLYRSEQALRVPGGVEAPRF